MRYKTCNYTVVMNDGSLSERVWGGNASTLRKSMQANGEFPTAIFQRVKPLWTEESQMTC